eukprot:186442_1
MLSNVAGLIIWLSCCVLLMIVVLIFLLFRVYVLNKSVDKCITPMTILLITFYVLTGLGDLNHAALSYVNNKSLATNYYFSADLADIFFFISNLLLYTLLLSRLYFTFQYSQYQISNKFIIFIVILMLIVLALIIFYCAFLVPQYGITKQFFPFAISLMITDIIINMLLGGLFGYKLYQTVKSQQNQLFMQVGLADDSSLSSNSSNMSVNEVSSTDINNSQRRLVLLITKHTILSIIIVTINQLFWVLEVINIFYKQNEFTYCLTYGIRTFQCMVITFILYLNCQLNHQLYHSMCNYCHVRCYNWCYNFV